MDSSKVLPADEWAQDYLKQKRASSRSRRISFSVADLVIAFMAGVAWEKERGLVAIQQRTEKLERDLSSRSHRNKRTA